MTRTDRRRFLVLFAAIAALIALFGALALPATAQAQDSTCTLNTGDLWCGEVTVAELSEGFGTIGHGFFDAEPDQGALSDTTFSVGTNDYTIDLLYVNESQDGGFLQFSLTSDLTDADKATLVLHIDGSSDTFAFSAAGGPNAVNGYEWEDTGLDWSSTSKVTLPPASTDATLSDLTVTGGGSDLVTFVSGTFDYAASVANGVTEVTVTPMLSDTNATIVWLDGSDMTLADANASTAGQQVTLVEGDNVIKVKVTAEDTTTILTYAVTVNRPAATTCTLNTGDIWCGVVTVGTVIDQNGVTTGHGFEGTTGDLSDKMFTVGTNPYTINAIITGSGNAAGYLSLALTDTLSNADENDLVLHVDNDSFAFSAASRNSAAYNWASYGLDWSDGNMVTLRLRRAAAANVAPAFTSAATFGVDENGTTVGTVEASDDDMDDEITGYADQALFSINDSGVLTFQAAPDYEDPQDANTDNAYEVTVQATSGTGGREQTAIQTITVTVMNANEQQAKPAKPTVTAVSGATDSLAVSWSEPDLNGGPAITGYGVEYRVGATGTWTDWSHSGTDATTTITGLTADTDYQVQVRALNGETPSDWSDPSDAVRTNAEMTPVVTIAKDKNVFLEEAGAADFTLSRTGSTTAALTVTVEVTQETDRDILPDGAAAERTVTFAVGSAATTLSVALDNDDLAETFGKLTVEVQAGAGYTVGDPASATVSVGDTDTRRPTPANLMASPGAGAGEVVLSWDAHAPQLLFTLHEYRYKTDGNYLDAWTDIPNSGQWDTNAGDGSNLTGYTVTGLVGGQVHSFQVRTSFPSTDFSAASNEAMATPRSAVVSFGAGSYSVDEGGAVEVTVQLDAAPGREVVVPVSAAGAGGATPPGETGADWSGVPENVTFGATDTAMTFTLAATQDLVDDDGESVALSFGTLPDGVTAGSPPQATVTITDDDTAASTCTLNTGDLWCGVVTPGELTSGDGFFNTIGGLSDTEFEYGTTMYTITSLHVSDSMQLGFSLNAALTTAAKAKLVLHVGTTSFAFSDASYSPGPKSYTWSSTGLDWSSTSSVTVRLREAATPPDASTNFTATVGDTQVALAWKAAALDSGVTGHEFRYKTDGSYPATWTAIANSGPDEANEDSFHGDRAHQRGGPHLRAPRGERLGRGRRGHGGAGDADARHLRPHAADPGRDPGRDLGRG